MRINYLDDCPLGSRYFSINRESFSLNFRMVDYYRFDYRKITNQIHLHDCFELIYIVEGQGVFLLENEPVSLSEGALFLTDPGEHHEIHIEKGNELTLIYLMFTLKDKRIGSLPLSPEEKVINRFLQGHRRYDHNQAALSSYISFFEQYTSCRGDRSNPWFVRTAENFVMQSLDSLCLEKPLTITEGGVEQSLLDNAIHYIDRNLAFKMTANDIAGAIHTSRRNLYKLFHNYMDRPVHDYIKEKKMALARDYLQMKFTVSETATLVGMPNLSQFSKTFKQYEGLSPRDYRKQHCLGRMTYGLRSLPT